MMSNDVTTDFAQVCGQRENRWPLAFSLSGIETAVAAGRVSYCLGLQGPAVCVNTACSSSLVALDSAAMALAFGRVDQAVVIGVSLMLSPLGFIATCKAGMLCPDGRCKTFDASANGFARGEGCGAVVLKRAVEVDTVHALLRGIAVNQDGRSAGLTAPSGPAQASAIKAALRGAAAVADEVSYVETHGTGTPLGDPIETGALSEVFKANDREMVLGAVKTNLGHCEAAAGMAGLMKTVLVLQRKTAPPNLHLKELNPLIENIPGGFKPVFPSQKPEALRLPAGESSAALGGLSAFGFSGTNAHVLLESPPHPQARKPIHKRVAFLCTGQGSQYSGMGRELMDAEPAFRSAMERCDAILDGVMKTGLLEVIYETEEADLINETRYAQPCLFAVEYSLSQLWKSKGVTPDVVMGHSLGEYVAACISGLLSLETALVLVARRAELMADLPSNGAMAAVFQSEESLSAAILDLPLKDEVCIACVNGPKACIVSGTSQAVNQLQKALGGAKRSLTVSHAFHSPLMVPILDDFASLLADVVVARDDNGVKFVSNLRGANGVPSAAHWMSHVTDPVDFLGGMQSVVADGCEVLVELGPTPTLVKMGRRCVEAASDLVWVSSMELPSTNSASAGSGFGAAVAAVIDCDAHHYSAASLPWHSKTLTHPIMQRTAEDDAVVAHATGMRGPHVVGLIDGRTMASLSEHVISGSVMMPAAAMIDAAVAAVQHTAFSGTRGAQASKSSRIAVVLQDVLLQRPLRLTHEAGSVRTCVGLDGSRMCFSSHAYSDDAKEVIHMSASYEVLAEQSAAPTDRQDIEKMFEGLAQADAEGFYAHAAANGLEYGDDFRGITELWAFDDSADDDGSGSEGVVMAKLRPSSQSGAWKDSSWDPTVLDALFQLNIALSPMEALIPFVIGRIELLSPIKAGTTALFGRAKVTHSSPGVQVSDLTLIDGTTGSVLVHVKDFEVRKPAVESALKGCAWSIVWEAAQSNWETAVERIDVGLSGIDLSKAKIQTAEGLRGLLLLANGTVDGVRFAEQASVCDLTSADEGLLKQGWLACVVLVEPRDDSYEAALLAIIRLLNLASEIGFSDPIWIVTEGCQEVGHGITSPKSAGIWGLCRTVRIEMPQLQLGCLDISPNSNAELCRWQVRQKPSLDPEVSIYDLQNDSVRRVPRLREVPSQTAEEVAFKSDRTYVITGGLSGFGIRTAVWMCSRGAKHLALLSRSGAVQTSDTSAVADWKQLQSLSDVTTQAVSCDIADMAALTAALAKIQGSGMPPLGGVIHAAGVLRDALLDHQDESTLRAVLAAKVDGAYNLHEATASCDPPLEVFLVYSSVAGMLGSAAQANYAAANSCLDSFVAWRRLQGLAAASLAWGPLAEVGMAARHGTAKRVKAHGLGELSLVAAFAALDLGLSQAGPATVLAVPAEWSKWARRFPASAPLLQHLMMSPAAVAPTVASVPRNGFGSATDGAAANQSVRVAAMSAAPQVDVRQQVVSSIEQLIGEASASQLEDGSELLTCGLDSLGTMELRQTLSRVFDVDLPPNFLSEHPTLGELVTLIEKEMPPPPSAAIEDEENPTMAPWPATPRAASAHALCQIWDDGVGKEVASAAASFFGGVAPVLLGPTGTGDGDQCTVIVIGWAGASVENISPIVSWHRNRGSRVLQLLPALTGALDAECYAAVDALGSDEKMLAGRCYLHCFSNNSVFFLRRMLSDHPRPFERPRLLVLSTQAIPTTA